MKQTINLQGDCGFEWGVELPENAKLLNHKILLTGEGPNKHIAVCEKDDDVLLYEKDGVVYCVAKKTFRIEHDTHPTQTVVINKPDVGIIRQPLEFDPFKEEIRKQCD